MNVEQSNTPIVDKAITEALIELEKTGKTGYAINDQMGYVYNFILNRTSELQLVYKAIDKSDIREDRSNWKQSKLGKAIQADIGEIASDRVIGALTNSKAFLQVYYEKAYKGLKESDTQYESWGDLLTEIYEEDLMLNEIFVRLVEEQEGVLITSAKQLQELTGITHIGEGTDKQTRAEAFKQMEGTFTNAMKYRYAKELEAMLDGGGKYSDLLQTDPAKYHLKESDRAEVIRTAIYNSFELGDIATMRPNIRDIAKTIGAPYDIVLSASPTNNDEPEN